MADGSKEDPDIAWLSDLSDQQWAQIRMIGRELLEAGYFEGNQFKIAVMAFLMWTLEGEVESGEQTEMPNVKIH